MEFTAVSWNLFHGRDFPPDPVLFTWRSRLLRIEERNETHAQVNRGLLAEFAEVLAGGEWDVALLQECPPRFAEPLAKACGAEAHRVLTSRNSLSVVRAWIARRNPDLIASGEGGSNLTLVRTGPGGCIVELREMEIHRGRPERRAMAFTRIRTGDGAALCVANLHATNDRPELATADVLRAAEAAVEWADGTPLLFGGDLNLRPAETPAAFERLHAEYGLTGMTGAHAIDHLLARGLESVHSPRSWPPEGRELDHEGLQLRLSDHAPVEARFKTGTG